MNSDLSNSSLFRSEQLNSLNSAVLNIIHHKKYPLNYHLLNSSHLPSHYHIRKLSTNPSQSITKTPTLKTKLGRTGRQSPGNRKKRSIRQQSMGEHLQTIRTKQMQLAFSQGNCFDEISQKLNSYLWQKKKERCIMTEKNEKQEDLVSEIQRFRLKQQQSQKQAVNLTILLKNFRKSLLNEMLNQTEPNEFDLPSMVNIKHQTPQLKSIDFYQGEKQRCKLARKYPIKGVRMREDLNKQLIADMASELKENQYCEREDRYSKMRIMANHKKIISMG